jgi:hypothetical protein
MKARSAPRRTAPVGASLLANPGCSAEHSFREQARSYGRLTGSRVLAGTMFSALLVTGGRG